LQQQQLLLQEVCRKWLHTDQWQQLLSAIVTAHGVAAAAEVSGAALLPQCGAYSLVFTVGGVVVKLLVGQEGLCVEM
jgi:hypothetical protein